MLADCIREAPVVHDADKAAKFFSELQARINADGPAALAHLIDSKAGVRGLLLGIFGASPYLTSLCLREPGNLSDCLNAAPDERLASWLGELEQAMARANRMDEAMHALRLYKRRCALLIALADLAGFWTVEQATQAMSAAADALLRHAVRFLLRQAAQAGRLRLPGGETPEQASGYIVLGMGKYGAEELNYSSDIDLIVFYDLLRTPLAKGVEPQPFFVRLTRDLVRLLQERTAGGYVFRTDLRLRPDPGSTQVALSTGAGFHYYESFGQNWERAAYIKARAAAGDIAAGEEFLRQLSPYVWRKYLDYAAIADIHAIKRQIHAFKGHAEIAVAGHNLKLGRGGIREIEFFVQTQQLIAGGRQPSLRTRQTLTALEKLAERGWITSAAAAEMAGAYRFLRRIEHRLQMIADEQTQTLPSKPRELERLAHFSGFADSQSFAAALTGHFRRVEAHYAALFEDVPELTSGRDQGNLVFTGDSDDPATLETLSNMGFGDPSSVIAMVRGWHFGRYPAVRSVRARERLTEFTPALLEALAGTVQPGLGLANFDKFLSELPTGMQLFALLRNNPDLLQLVASIMGSAPRLARVLSRRRRVLDAVLDPGFLGHLPSEEMLENLIHTALAPDGLYEDCLNSARIIGQEQAFLIGVRVLSGAISAEQAGSAYTALAENLIAALQRRVEAELERLHGRLQNGQAAVIAMGKLGGREMTANSDLDLITVYDFDAEVSKSGGLKPLEAPHYYARLTQRLISALSAPTPEGSLYAVDMRLRPSGNAGPVAASLQSFIEYQHNQAWTWEHMALTRARVISGSGALRDAISATIAAVLCRPRDQAKIAVDVRAMHGKIQKEKGTKDIWDLKHMRGGLIDIEFITQYLLLIHAAKTPAILDQNTLTALGNLAAAGILTPADADILIPAARLYHNLTQTLRVCFEGPFAPERAPGGLKALLAYIGGAPDFARLEVTVQDYLRQVEQVFDGIIPIERGV